MTGWEELRTDLVRYFRGRVRDAATAEDLAHDTLLKVHEGLPGLRTAGRLRPWVHGIARRRLADHFRRARPAQALPSTIVAEPPDDTVHRAVARWLEPLANDLPPTLREAFRLHEFDGRPLREVATRLGISLAAAKARVRRARERLGELLLACCELRFDAGGRVASCNARGECDC